jgi:type IV secretory pathway protease TraF
MPGSFDKRSKDEHAHPHSRPNAWERTAHKRSGGDRLAALWNASASVPIGLYYVEPENHLAVTDLVVVSPPEPVAGFLAQRDYLSHVVPLLKQVIALPGQNVCRNHLAIMIDGVVLSFARERDHRGRPLPVWFRGGGFCG